MVLYLLNTIAYTIILTKKQSYRATYITGAALPNVYTNTSYVEQQKYYSRIMIKHEFQRNIKV